MPPRNIDRLTRVYGPTTWDVYERLDVSLDPAGPDQLHDLATDLLPTGGTVLDVGCRDAADLIRLVQGGAATGVGVEPVALHVERARAAVAAAGLADRIDLHEGGVEDRPDGDGRFDLVWCRDVLSQVADLDAALGAMARALADDGHALVFATFATDLLAPREAEMLDRHLGNVPGTSTGAGSRRPTDGPGCAPRGPSRSGPSGASTPRSGTSPCPGPCCDSPASAASATPSSPTTAGTSSTTSRPTSTGRSSRCSESSRR